MPFTVDLAAKAYQKYYDGQSLSDAEVKAGAQVFMQLAQDLRKFGPRFDLAANEFALKGNQFHDFAEHRKRDKR